MLTTTMKDIRAAGPCEEGWTDLREHLGLSSAEAKTDTNPVSLATVLESNGLDDALWVLDNVIKDIRIIRLYNADCAERVLSIFEKYRPDDPRPREAIVVARNFDATDDERVAARAAAWDAAGAAAWDAAGAAARAAAREAAREAQKQRLSQYIEHGEAAASMPWPELGVTS